MAYVDLTLTAVRDTLSEEQLCYFLCSNVTCKMQIGMSGSMCEVKACEVSTLVDTSQ